MANNPPLITIITNTKNRAHLIFRCIESIRNQTYKNYEHIIADGGSDNTKDVVAAYNDPQIKYISVPQGGPVAQTREAFKLSKGDYITFLDDDDEYLPEKLEKQLELIQSLPDDYGFIYGSMSYYDNNTKEYIRIHKAEIEGGIEILSDAVARPTVCGTPTFMFRRHVFESIGGTWVSGIGNEMSDWALGCKALQLGWKVAALKKSYLKIYVNHESTRMSDQTFYSDNNERYIKFHNHFLTEYDNIISQNPKSAIYHYECLINYYIASGFFYKAFKIWTSLLKLRTNLRSFIIFPYYAFKHLFQR